MFTKAPSLLQEKLHMLTILVMMILSIVGEAVSADDKWKLNFSEVNFKWEIGKLIGE